MAFRSVRPDAGLDEIADFLALRLGADLPKVDALAELYADYDPIHFDSNDRAYLADVHPLELWLVNHLQTHPQASLPEIYTASALERQVAYEWLFKTRHWRAQQQRILIVLEQDAFEVLHRQWQRLGYPFDNLVPSYATALGVSADRPSALAELMGIIVNGGEQWSMRQIETLHFAIDTPYETVLNYNPGEGRRLLSPEICELLRRALIGVVESGSARRIEGVFHGSGGEPIAIGGKTGTGDHLSKYFAAGGRLIEVKVENRNAIFTFFLADRFFGTVMVHVGGARAADFKFTSSLAVQVLKVLQPVLQPLIDTAPRQAAVLDTVVADR